MLSFIGCTGEMCVPLPAGPERRDHPENEFPTPGLISRSSLPALSNSLLPFVESSYYYYCHHKGLDLHIAK